MSAVIDPSLTGEVNTPSGEIQVPYPSNNNSIVVDPSNNNEDTPSKERKKGSGRPKGSKDKPRLPGAPRRGRPPKIKLDEDGNVIPHVPGVPRIKKPGAKRGRVRSPSPPNPTLANENEREQPPKYRPPPPPPVTSELLIKLFEEWSKTFPSPKSVSNHTRKFLEYFDEAIKKQREEDIAVDDQENGDGEGLEGNGEGGHGEERDDDSEMAD